MTDRPMHSDPSPNLGPHLAAVERRLARRTPADPPATLRSRILMTVDDAAETVPATPSRQFASRQSAHTDSLASSHVVAGTVLAMSMLLLPLVAMAVAAPRLDRSPPRMLSFVERARLAGIMIDSTPAPARAPGPLKPLPDRKPRAFDARALLERTLLQGDL